MAKYIRLMLNTLLLTCSISAVFCADFAGTPSAQSKVALIIGNANYAAPLSLTNPAHDAEDIAAALRRLDFEVILLTDANKQAMEQGLNHFDSKMRGRSAALFYYAGHGVQVGGENYLVPIGSQISNASEVASGAINVHAVLDTMEKANTPMNIIILDACRDNPFLELASFDAAGMRGLGRSAANNTPVPTSTPVKPATVQSTPGLNAAVDGPAGYLVAFATSPGKTTSDGASRNGLYTKYLLDHLETPNITIEEMFKRVLNGVRDETHGQQTPWVNSAFKGEFCFAGCALQSSSPARSISSYSRETLQSMPKDQEMTLPAVGFGF